jgi:O-acetylhomoserine (thiol)-lyase
MGDFRFETLAVHAGHEPDPVHLSRGVPLHRTTSFVFKSVEHGADLFALRTMGNIYTRMGNPTQDILERRITALEGGAASVAFASGTNAIFSAVITIARNGDEIVSANNLYGGTYTQFGAILTDFGIKTSFVDPGDPENFERAITDRTRLVFIETIGNPALDFADIKAIADMAHRNGLPLVVDGTFTTPYLLRTIDHGADIVINSLTKWIGGQGSAIGGMVTDAGCFDWRGGRFSLFNEPDHNYHGLRWAHDLPSELAHIPFAMRLRTVPLRNLGGCISPDNAWIFIQGSETLPLRMDRHCSNAMRVAEYLKSHHRVAWVRYPGLSDDPSYETASRYMKRGFGGMVVFGIRGGLESGRKFVEGLRLFSHLANVGDSRSLVLHPASTSHSQLTEEQRRAGGVTQDLIRLSIGIEHIDDILEDLEQALERAF